MSTDTSDRRPAAFRSVTRLVLALMAVLFVVGCGSSRGEFVVPGPGPGPGLNTGTLIYNFNVNPQAPLDVPAGITRVEFDLHNGPNGTGAIIDSRNVPFNTTITLNNVSTAVESSVLTFYNEFNFPVLRAVVDVDVIANTSTVVDFAGANAFVPTFDALTATASPTNLNIGDTSQIVVTAAFGVGTPVTIATGDLANAGVTFESSNPAVASVDANGLVTGVAFGTATVTAELTTNGSTHSDTVDFNVSGAVGELAYITVTPAAQTLPISNANLDFEFPLAVAGFDSFDDPVAIDLDNDFTVTSSDTDVATVAVVDGEVVVTTGLVEGTTTITVTNDDDNTITASSEITTIDAHVVSITADQVNPELYVSEVADITFTATLSDANGTLVPNFPLSLLTITAGDEFLNFVDGDLVALQETGDPPAIQLVTFEVDPDITDNNPVDTDVDVTIRRVQMTEVAVRIGGIDVDLTATTPSASIPEGYTGVVEVIGTFEDGSVRELAGNGNDYDVNDPVTNFTRIVPGLFQTNEAFTASGTNGQSGTLTITLAADRGGDIDPIDIDLTIVDAGNPAEAGATFTNYDDEDRLLIENGPAREVDLRVNFDGVQNFRIAHEDVSFVTATAVLAESFGHWPMVAGGNGTYTNVNFEFEIGPGGNTDAVTVFLNGVTSVEADFFGILPATITPLTPGQSASFSTFVDYGQGQVNRTADYPVFEEFYDFISEVYVTLDADAGAVNFFLKRTPNNPPLSVRIVDLTGAPQTAIGTGVDTVQITAP